MVENKKAVIFDLDGTLVDSMCMWKDIDIEYLGQHHIELPENLQADIEGLSFGETAVYFKQRFALEESLEEIKNTWLLMAEDKYRNDVELKPGVPDFLKYIKKNGLKCGIASSNSLHLINTVLQAHKIQDYFDVICTCDDIKTSKPEPDIYLHAAKKLGVAPADCLVFEDIPAGIEAGKRAGMTTCAVSDTYSRKDDRQKKEMADGFISDYREVFPRYDFVYVIGDAYVDHPSFGCAIITQVLRSRGYSVAIIEQPDWKDDTSITKYGEPRLGFLVSAGNMDSMVNHYTVAKKHRSTDAYTPGGKMGLRPDRAVTVYGNLIRKTYKHTPVILGGIEASLRRMAHYDYWADEIKRSVLLDSGANLISYGMGEHSIVEIADALNSGISIDDITFIAGTVYKSKTLEQADRPILLPAFDQIKKDKKAFAKSFLLQYENTDPIVGRPLAESYGTQGYVIANPPAKPLTEAEMDDIYALPYTRKGADIPAMKEIQFSLTSNRGCFGGCNFCALTYHQGRTVQVRSHESLLEEAVGFTKDPAFKGYIHDVGGPTADFRIPSCQKQLTKGVCKNRQCLVPTPCKNLEVSHKDYLELLRKLRALPKVKKVFIRSGIRFDYVMEDKDPAFLKELVEHHVSGQLRVAPEHVSNPVLAAMGKPPHEVYDKFLRTYDHLNQKAGLKQFAVPYFMSSHPGCTLKDAIKLAEYVRDLGFTPEQVQDFYPTPSTLSTCMYYTGMDPRTLAPVYVPKNPHEKAMQRALLQYKNPKNYELVREALIKAERTDLIGFDRKCLIRPRKGEQTAQKPKTVARKKKTIRNVHKKK